MDSSGSPSLYADPADSLASPCTSKTAAHFHFSDQPESAREVPSSPVWEPRNKRNCDDNRVEAALAEHRECVCPARDWNLLGDDRVFCNLLAQEEKQRSFHGFDYFHAFQPEIKPQMRQILVEWMLDVCEEERADPNVFPLAVCYLDRFLSVQAVYKSQLQGLGASCLFLASKIKQPVPLSAARLASFTDHSVAAGQIMSWELLILNRLKWDVACVTAMDMVEQVLSRLPLPNALVSKIRPKVYNLVKMIQNEHELCLMPASLQTCVCVCLAGVRALGEREALPNLLEAVHAAVAWPPTVVGRLVNGVWGLEAGRARPSCGSLSSVSV